MDERSRDWRTLKGLDKWKYVLWDLGPGLFKEPMLTLIRHRDTRDLAEPIIFRLRWALVVAFLIRAFLQPKALDAGLLAMMRQQRVWLWALLSFVLYALVLEGYRWMQLRRHNEGRRKEAFPRRKEARLFILLDCVSIGLFLALSRRPESDIPFFFAVPLIMGAQYLPVRNNGFAPWVIAAVFLVAAPATIYLSQDPHTVWMAVRMIAPKAIALVLIGLYLMWTLLHLGCTEQMLRAVFEESGEGMTFIGQQREACSEVKIDMRLLRLNEAQRRFAPSARDNGGTCRDELGSVDGDPNSACRWCPVVPVLNKEGPENSRSITRSWIKNVDGTQDQGYFDVTASRTYNELNDIIGAVEIVKETTPQIQLALLAPMLFSAENEEDVISLATDAFRRMFRVEMALYIELRNSENGISTVVKASHFSRTERSKEEHDWPTVTSSDLWDELKKQPRVTDVLTAKAKDEPRERRPWEFWRVPSSSDLVTGLARAFGVGRGIVARVERQDANCLGVLLGGWGSAGEEGTEQGNGAASREFTYLDVITAGLASDMTGAAQEHAAVRRREERMDKERIRTLERLSEQASQRERDLYTLIADLALFEDAAKRRDPEHVIGMCLLGVTHRAGLRFSRAMFLRLKGQELQFALGLGPVWGADENWRKPGASTLKNTYENPVWLDAIRQNDATGVGKDCRPVQLSELQGSVILKAIVERRAQVGTEQDPFLKKALPSALQIKGPFAVAPVHFLDDVMGVIVADRGYLEQADATISDPDVILLDYMASVAGPFLASTQGADQAVKGMMSFLREYDPAVLAHCGRMGELAERVAIEKGLGPENARAVRMAAVVADLGLLKQVGLPLWKQKKTLDGQEKAWAEHHPHRARAILEAIDAPEVALRAVRDHRDIGLRPNSAVPDEKVPAAILNVVEYYLALTENRPFRNRAPLERKAALEQIREEYGATWYELVGCLDRAEAELAASCGIGGEAR